LEKALQRYWRFRSSPLPARVG